MGTTSIVVVRHGGEKQPGQSFVEIAGETLGGAFN